MSRCPNCLTEGGHWYRCPKATIRPAVGAGVNFESYRLLTSSLNGRALALDQIAGLLQRLPCWRRRSQLRRDYLVGELRAEARRARYDLDKAREWA